MATEHLDPPHEYLLAQVQIEFEKQFPVPRLVSTASASERPAPAATPHVIPAGADPSSMVMP